MNKKEFIEEVKNAFIWEGSARVYPQSDTKLEIHGTSLVEHRGDENALVDQALQLKDVSFTDETNNKTYCVTDVTCEINVEGRISSDEYTIYVRGSVEYKEVITTEIKTK